MKLTHLTFLPLAKLPQTDMSAFAIAKNKTRISNLTLGEMQRLERNAEPNHPFFIKDTELNRHFKEVRSIKRRFALARK